MTRIQTPETRLGLNVWLRHVLKRIRAWLWLCCTYTVPVWVYWHVTDSVLKWSLVRVAPSHIAVGAVWPSAGLLQLEKDWSSLPFTAEIISYVSQFLPYNEVRYKTCFMKIIVHTHIHAASHHKHPECCSVSWCNAFEMKWPAFLKARTPSSVWNSNQSPLQTLFKSCFHHITSHPAKLCPTHSFTHTARAKISSPERECFISLSSVDVGWLWTAVLRIAYLF